LHNVWQAVYTAGVVIPRPIATATYLHRSINAKKLIEVGFSGLSAGETMASHLKKNKIPGEGDYVIDGLIREMLKKDISGVYKLLSENLAKY
jgi:glycylpeptide N-tetradecanoyltransferase